MAKNNPEKFDQFVDSIQGNDEIPLEVQNLFLNAASLIAATKDVVSAGTEGELAPGISFRRVRNSKLRQPNSKQN